MGEVIYLASRIKEETTHSMADSLFLDCEELSRSVFVESLLLLEELGYDCSEEDTPLVKDIECLSYLATAIIFRAKNLKHPYAPMLDKINLALDENMYQLETLIEDIVNGTDVEENIYAQNDN
jgi:hypothetical protein